MTSLNLRFHLAGYSGLLLPRALRRLIAGSQMHRAWLQGDMGVHVEDLDGEWVFFGVCDRDWMQYRKGPSRTVAPLRKITKAILFPFSN
ncbi:hypothetical protein [Stutzerimonas stutzeri]|uniref:hypothetical protein n=1 Tax=Stutzerimonas stutzeri TaxID=316 RepID=UPI0015E32B3E|nr:hypothetical protein [Stutzerimonas stutzeri]MBA1280435.1 hypothetical protein [Stutzerimonas stutzeri]